MDFYNSKIDWLQHLFFIPDNQQGPDSTHLGACSNLVRTGEIFNENPAVNSEVFTQQFPEVAAYQAP